MGNKGGIQTEGSRARSQPPSSPPQSQRRQERAAEQHPQPPQSEAGPSWKGQGALDASAAVLVQARATLFQENFFDAWGSAVTPSDE